MGATIATHTHVLRMLDEIHQHYADRLNLATLARTLGRQAAYLGRLFREQVGATVHDYVTRLRIDNGALQVSSGVKIEAVALCIGYRSKKNFYRQFKRRFGCTPEEYRHRRGAAGPTERRHARSAEREASTLGPLKFTLRAQTLLLKTFADSPLAVLATDRTGRYVGANCAAVSMTGYSVADLRCMTVATLLETDQPIDGVDLLQILVLPSAQFHANAVLHAKTAGPVSVHCISHKETIRKRDEFASIVHDGTSREPTAPAAPAGSH